MLLAMCRLASIRSGVLHAQKVRTVVRHNSNNNASDRHDLSWFASPSSFLRVVLNVMFNPFHIVKFYDLKHIGVLPSRGLMSPVWTYFCLQNPLLRRYDINGADLVAGAQAGFEAINEAVSSMNQSEMIDYFRALAPANYQYLPNSFCSSKSFHCPELLRTKDAQPEVILRNVVTKIVGDVPGKYDFPAEAVWLIDDVKQPTSWDLQKMRYDKDFANFPHGTVLAYIDVEYVLPGAPKAKFKPTPGLNIDDFKKSLLKFQYDNSTVLSFRACISGQVPLEWTLVDINGPRGLSHALRK